MKQHADEKRGLLNTVKWTCEQANMSRDTVMKLAAESGSLVRIGRMVKIQTDKFFDYIDKVYSVQDGKNYVQR